MLRQRTGSRWIGALLIGVLVSLASGSAIGQRPSGRPGGGGHPPGAVPGGSAHQHFDTRFSHNQYYFDRGYSVRRPPPGGLGELHGRDGSRYWYHGGDWYRRRGGWYRWWGGSWVVWGAPIGLFVPVLPPYYTTVWWQGVPYYYANDTYYAWDGAEQKYEVVEPPSGIDSGGATQAPASDQLFVYPKSQQSAEQQKKDRYECHRWAVSQSGFDPTVSGGGVAPEKAVEKRNDYFRAQISCLEGRGYSVK